MFDFWTNVTKPRSSTVNGKLYHMPHTAHQDMPSFKKYAQELGAMIERTQQAQDRLIDILKQLFDIKEQTIHPALKEAHLKTLMKDTRKIIVSIFIRCEEDFRKGLELFDDIIGSLLPS